METVAVLIFQKVIQLIVDNLGKIGYINIYD